MMEIDSSARISVVVPAYNRADLLPHTLDAILSQTLAPAEVIVVDDGSQDGTETLLRRYAPKVRAIRIGNSGDLIARNVGLRAASAELVAFCDSDDLWRSNFLAAMSELWRLAPGVKAAYGNFVIVRDGVWQQETKFDAAPAGYWDGLRSLAPGFGVFEFPIVERLIRFQALFASSIVVRRDFFLSIGGWDESVSRMIGCDFATALRLAEHAPLGILREALVGVRKHTGNISGDVVAMNLGDAEILEQLLATRPSLGRHAALIRDSIARRRRDALNGAFAERNFGLVRQLFAMLPASHRDTKVHAKTALSRLPPAVSNVLAAVALGAGTALRPRDGRTESPDHHAR
jgi:glycosyltransferase involved in cell wall biosynthesis